jgi:hypothetical protein
MAHQHTLSWRRTMTNWKKRTAKVVPMMISDRRVLGARRAWNCRQLAYHEEMRQAYW